MMESPRRIKSNEINCIMSSSFVFFCVCVCVCMVFKIFHCLSRRCKTDLKTFFVLCLSFIENIYELRSVQILPKMGERKEMKVKDVSP